jgi:hypothetical protein
MSAIVLNFPAAAVICGSCGKACSEDELSECPTCGDKYCGSAKTNCKAVCSCDRLALDLVDRVAMLRPSSLTRLGDRLHKLAYAVRQKLTA